MRTNTGGRAAHRLTCLAAVPLAVSLAFAGAVPAAASPVLGGGHAPVEERLDRGLVAATTPQGVHLSWRLLASEATGAGENGLTGTDFAVYRGDQRLATVTDSTNYLDEGADGSGEYRVVALKKNGKESKDVATARAWTGAAHDIPLNKPAGGVTPAGEAYTYRANDASVADLDGDGAYEYIVKWDPSNSKDVSQKGYTGNVYLDAYELDGTQLWRIDLGVNVRAGAHYTQVVAYDLDEDGSAEVMLKTAPGTSSSTYTDGVAGESEFITMLADDIAAGYGHDDDYRMSAADYREHVVEMFLGWHDHPEVESGDWPATLEEAFGTTVAHEYPLSRESAEQLADYFIEVYAPSRSTRNDLTTFEGFILDGPEYLTLFDGRTGSELDTVRYEPGRGDDGLLWGDYAMSRIEPGNRVDRFLSGVAYLDGESPSAIFARGYYTRSTVAAWTWDGRNLEQEWLADSGWTPMTNPFNDGPHGRDGENPEYATLTTQGYHSLTAADVDADGKQEIVYGSATLDHDGSLLYSSFDTLPPGSAAPGTEARLGHGDAIHVTDIDPARPGLEIFGVHEGATSAPFGWSMRDAATGETLFGGYTGRDTGRGMIGDVRTDVPGIEAWAVDLRSASGQQLGTRVPGTNQSVKWAADGTTQVVNGGEGATPTIDDWTRGRLVTATGTTTNNGTKGNAALIADVLGDWREEVLLRTVDSTALRIHLSTEVTGIKLYTLMADPQYRVEVARQNTAYNQPSYTSFYLASDTDWAQVPLYK